MQTEKPARLDRIGSHWVEWWLQSQISAAAQMRAQAGLIHAQIDAAPLQAGSSDKGQALQQARVFQKQAEVTQSAVAFCAEAAKGPYWARPDLDNALDKVLAEISEASDEDARLMKSGLWKLCKELGIPLGSRR